MAGVSGMGPNGGRVALTLSHGLDMVHAGLGTTLDEAAQLAHPDAPLPTESMQLGIHAKLIAAKAEGRAEAAQEMGVPKAEALAAQQAYFAEKMAASLGAPGPLAAAIGQAFHIQSQGGTTVQAMVPVLLSSGASGENVLAVLDLMSGTSPDEVQQHIAGFRAMPKEWQPQVIASMLQKVQTPPAPEPEPAPAPAPTTALLAPPTGQTVLGVQIPPYQSSNPSYEQYNVPPARFDSPAQVVDLIGKPGTAQDVRGNSYTLGTYLGADAQKEGIVAQQVYDVLGALRRGSPDPATFAGELKKNLNMSEERSQQLGPLAPQLEAFRQLPSLAGIAKDDATMQLVQTFVESSHNWGPQPEDFHGTAPIIKSLLEKPDFTSFLDEKLIQGQGEKQQVGLILPHLGYPQPVSRDLNEASMGVQAVDRLMFLSKDACGLVPLDRLPSSPAPFPPKAPIPAYAKDIQVATKLNLAVANGVQSGTVHLSPADADAFNVNRLRLAYLSAGELSGLLAKEAAATPGDRQAKINDTIHQLEIKRDGIAAALGTDRVKDLDIQPDSDVRAMMKPLMALSRNFFELALNQAVPSPDDRAKSLDWVQGFADLTSLKEG